MSVEPWLSQYVPGQGALALDIGANQGLWTALLAERFEEVHAFEPNPQVLPELRERVMQMRNVRLFETAVGGTPGAQLLSLYPESVHASGYTDAGLDTPTRGDVLEKIIVPLVSLSRLGIYTEQQGPRLEFIKIDTEGGEHQVLVGALPAIRLTLPRLVIEIHSRETRLLCEQTLTGLYAQLRHIPHPHEGVHPGHCWLVATR